MESLFPSAGQGTSLRCTPLGTALICVVLLALFYFLFLKDHFAPAGMGNVIRMQTRSQGAGFTGHAEPPVFWGSSGEQELYEGVRYKDAEGVEHLENIGLYGSMGVNETNNQFNPESGKAGFGGKYLTDASLAGRLGN
jgi:hypothetical protein